MEEDDEDEEEEEEEEDAEGEEDHLYSEKQEDTVPQLVEEVSAQTLPIREVQELNLGATTSENPSTPSGGDEENYQSLEDVDPSVLPSGVSDEELGGDAEDDLGNLNRGYRPFRDDSSMDHINAHIIKNRRERSSDSMCSMVSTSTIAPGIVKEKIKRQLKKKSQQQFARRVRKSGEAAIATKQRRENQLDIKDSFDGGIWS